MKKFLLLVTTAALGAAAVTALSETKPLGERVIQIETQRALPEIADQLAAWPPGVRLAFLDYAGDEALVLQGRLALLQYPNIAPRVLEVYGTEPAFKRILRRYGTAIIPPIHYFLANDIPSLELRNMVAGMFSGADEDQGGETVSEDVSNETAEDEWLTPEQRGWYAIEFIEQDGHDFLGQFVSGDHGDVSWVQTERFATGAKRFLTDGVTSLEAKLHLGDDTSASDYGWAAVDVLGPIVAFKAARLGKAAARSARSTKAAGRMARVGTGVARAVRIGSGFAAAGIAAGALYTAMNPAILTDLAANAADWLGVPAWAAIGTTWFLVFLPILWIASVGYRWFLRPLRPVMKALIALLTWACNRIDRRAARGRPQSEQPMPSGAARP